MASEQTEQAQPPASLASSDLAVSQRGEQDEQEAACWPNTSPWPPRCAGGHRGMQIQRIAGGCRHRQEEAGAYRKQRQHGQPQGKRDTPLARSKVTCGAATGQSLLPVRGGILHPTEKAYCTGEVLTRGVRRKPWFTNLCAPLTSRARL